MISLKPLRVLRPSAARAREFSTPRLDHLREEERRALGASHARSVAAMLHGSSVALQELVEARALMRHPEPTLYMHRQVKAGLRCTGVVALVQPRSFLDGSILPHRETAGEGVARHAEAQLDSVIVGFEDDEAVLDLIEREVNDRPLFHVLADDGATHSLWSGSRAAAVSKAFERVGRAMVLEGHRRVPVSEASDPVLAMLVPLSQVQARASLRVLTGAAAAAMRAHVQAAPAIESGAGEPPAGFADALWHEDAAGVVRRRFQLPAPHRGASVLEACAHGRLEAVLRASHGGAVAGAWRPAAEPDAHAWHEPGEVLVALPRPSMAELLQLAEEGLRLPAGSTWFEPRIRSGLWMAERAEIATTLAE